MNMLQQLFSINTATGVSLTLHNDGSAILDACQIIKNGKQLNFEKKATRLKSVEELDERFAKKSPISLNISGKGILYKQVEKVDELMPVNFSQLLPNAAFDDFYIQNFISGDRSFIAVIRKTDADKWVARLRDVGFNVVMLSLGGFPANTILPQLNVYDEEVVFNGHAIRRDEQKQWISYGYDASATAPFPLKIESEKIDEKLVMAYASAFQLVMVPLVEPVQATADTLAEAYRQTLSSRWIRAYGAISLVVVFVLLLINFIIFSSIDADNTKLAYQASRSAQNSSDVKALNDQVTLKEQKLKNLGWDGGISKAYLIDQLASDLPEEITWKAIEVNPVDNTLSRTQKSISFKERQIRVTGLSQQIIPVNEWMARIKIKKWVKGVQLENYSLNQELNTGQFTLIITY